MCRLLGVTRSLVYYEPTPHRIDTELENAVIEEFNNVYPQEGGRHFSAVFAKQTY